MSVRSRRAARRREWLTRREAFTLPLVLVVLAMMVQVAYQLNESMVESARRAARAADAARAREAAYSGLRLASTWLRASRDPRRADAVAFISLPADYALPTADDATASVRYLPPPGEDLHRLLEDESSKLAINALPLEESRQDAARAALLHLPRMTPQVADAILDWIDPDDQPRQYGAEQSYYAAAAARWPRNARIESLEELLLVRGVTQELLFGCDHNRDGRWDEDELRDREEAGAWDGWARYLTTVACERNRRHDGTARVYLNTDDAVALYDLLEPQVGAEVALYLSALRKVGPFNDDAAAIQLETPEDAYAAALRRAAQQAAGPSDAAPPAPRTRAGASRGGDTVRQGVDLGGQVYYRIRSLADVCGLEVHVARNEEDAILKSPWPADANGVREASRVLGSVVTCFAGEAVEGRINIREAPWQVIATLPGMTHELARAIATRRNSAASPIARHRAGDLAWLLDDRLMDWPVFREAMPFLAPQGDRYTVRCLGAAGRGSSLEYVVAILDASTGTIQPIRQSSTRSDVRDASLRRDTTLSSRSRRSP